MEHFEETLTIAFKIKDNHQNGQIFLNYDNSKLENPKNRSVGLKTYRPEQNTARSVIDKLLINEEVLMNTTLTLKVNGYYLMERLPLHDLIIDKGQRIYFPFKAKLCEIDWKESYFKINNAAVLQSAENGDESIQLTWFITKD
jgi:hypothetical protein